MFHLPNHKRFVKFLGLLLLFAAVYAVIGAFVLGTAVITAPNEPRPTSLDSLQFNYQREMPQGPVKGNSGVNYKHERAA